MPWLQPLSTPCMQSVSGLCMFICVFVCVPETMTVCLCLFACDGGVIVYVYVHVLAAAAL